jgi:hypothetical protein
METNNFIGKGLFYKLLIIGGRLLPVNKWLFLCFLLCGSLSIKVTAKDISNKDKLESSFTYDAIPVLVLVQGYGNFYVDAIFANDDLLYVNIEDLFRSLSIPCIIGQGGTILTGFIVNDGQTYSVDFSKGQIMVGDKIVNYQNGLIKEMGSIYLESSLFAVAFGIELTFNFRSLSLILKSDFELPIVRQQRINKMRDNLSKFRGEEIADTTIQRNYHLFKFGTIDWSAASFQTWKGNTSNRFGLGVGAELLYGEANVSVTYYDQYKFDNRQLYYLWNWVDNDKSLIKQAQVGRISNHTIAFINSPVIGATIRNSPTTVRKATGYYTINEFTHPNWDVELYINNVMVDFTKADASGLFVFQVPIVYGYTTLKLKFYGPMGEERIDERTINLPYSIMLTGEFEYSLSAGILQDSSMSRFARGEFNYGLNRSITIGGGLEYLSSIPNGAFIPFVKATLQPFSKLTFNAEYAYGVKTRGVMNYYFWKNAQIEIDYTNYVDGQLATRFNALEERKVKLFLPYRIKGIIGFSRFDFSQFVYKSFNYNRASAVFSSYYKQFSANSTTQFNWIDSRLAYISTDLALAYRVKGYVFRPSAKYNISKWELMTIKIAFEKSIPNGYITASYQRNMQFNDNFVSVSVKYDLSFARINASASHGNGTIYTSESIQGSLAFGSGNSYVHTSSNPSVGKGGISIYPFLDLNGNGIFDHTEPLVKLSSVRVMGGKAKHSEKDSIIRITDLMPFTKYNLTFSDTDLESISWRFKHKTYEVLVDPNQFKRIDIPVVVVGEYSGIVYLKQGKSLKGIGRILINFYKKGIANVYAKTLSESDGYIYCLGFEPGEYVARIDSSQLNNLNYSVEPKQIEFIINPSIEGDMVFGANFVLNDNSYIEIPEIEPSVQVSDERVESVFEEDETTINEVFVPNLAIYSVINPLEIQEGKHSKDWYDDNALFWGEICNQPGKYYVQCGAFRIKSNATNLALFISKETDKAVAISFIDGYYKVQVGCVDTREEAEEIRIWMEEVVINTDMFFKARRRRDVINTPSL